MVQRNEIQEIVRRASEDVALIDCRAKLAMFAAQTFAAAGRDLHVLGDIVGPDRVSGVSPRGHGSDEAVAVSVILRIGSQLVSASADLFADGRAYAAAALVRQVVELEYLAWAFEARDRDAERWLRSTRREREEFFRPAKLRQAAQGKFRGVDYSHHCEMGGHPVPKGTILLREKDLSVSQLLLADLLGHVGRTWDHIVGWATRNSFYGTPILSRSPEMSSRFGAWKSQDPLVDLPAPPPLE